VHATRIDRRSFGRRTQDLLGEPMLCDRFRSDLGPVSRWVARRRLSTLPFLLNVLRGEMALVGPLPELEDTVLRWRDVVPEFDRRFSVLPGVTGLAQIAGTDQRDASGVARRIQYDLHYVDHRSLVLDLRTLFRTAAVIFGPARRQPPASASPAVTGPATSGGPSTVKGVTQ
jgi:lipopolysaccharide/colanic/teichoic acid biosynthesis glycosyltransferase